jgi:hypothetical protein
MVRDTESDFAGLIESFGVVMARGKLDLAAMKRMEGRSMTVANLAGAHD